MLGSIESSAHYMGMNRTVYIAYMILVCAVLALCLVFAIVATDAGVTGHPVELFECFPSR